MVERIIASSTPSALPIAVPLKAKHHTQHRGGREVGTEPRCESPVRMQAAWVESEGSVPKSPKIIAGTLNQLACLSESISYKERFICFRCLKQELTVLSRLVFLSPLFPPLSSIFPLSSPSAEITDLGYHTQKKK